MQRSQRKPLEGIRVLDLTRVICGPYCTRMLADCGAEVIKVEPAGGEYMRRKEPKRDGASTYFGHLNAGKKSIEVDFRSEEDLDKVRRLAGRCDILVENFRPGVIKQLGLDYGRIAALRPDIVYCSISGFGQEGPRAEHPAYAPILHALSGHDLAALSYERDLARPQVSGIWYADVVGGVYAFGAIQTALISKLRHGTGQFIDLSLMDTMINLLILEVQEAQTPSAYDRWLATPVEASDGYAIVVPITDRTFSNLTKVIGRPEWLEDPRFSKHRAREKNWAELMGLIEQWTRQRPAQDCEKIMMDAGIPCARYMTVAEVMDEPQVAARNLFSEVKSSAGVFKVPNLPFQLSGSPIPVSNRVPAVGEHTREVMLWLESEDDPLAAKSLAS